MKRIIHYPTLKTVLMVEDVLKREKRVENKSALKDKLPKKIMDQTLNLILDYLGERGMIVDTGRGIVWTYTPDIQFERVVRRAIHRKMDVQKRIG